MKIAFVHHHFRPGGVTRVITEQMKSLRESNELLLLLGEHPVESVPFPFVCIPSLAYDRDRRDRDSAKEIADALLGAVRSFWPAGADLFHIHNPTLGKNRDFIKTIKILIERGIKLLLQIHDFAEDGRSENYQGEGFPQDTHYAVLNRRDYTLLLRSGLREEGLHLIPNSVRQIEVKRASAHRKDEGVWRKDTVLYPVRAIRRKNIGEAVLLSLFLKPHRKVGITLEPTGELDTRSYTDWRCFVQEKNLNVRFGLGVHNPFGHVLGKAACIITTSIKEGFGLTYLEPWTVNKMLFGRLLPDVCSDFIEKGLDLGHLYTSLRMPLSFIDRGLFFTKWKKCYMERMDKYALRSFPERLDELLETLIEDECIDFGYLSEDLQKKLILLLLKSRKSLKKVLDLNPFLEKIQDFEQYCAIVNKNKQIVLREYSGERNSAILREIYGKVIGTTVRHSADRSIVLDFFNTPERLFLLLCDGSYD